MKIFLTTIACLFTFTFTGMLAAAEPVPGDLQLFLLIGQSNMAGRGKVEAQDTLTHPRIFMFTQAKQWTLAKDPVHFDKPVAGTGLASEFARVLAKANPQMNIGLIPCAVGGTSLDQWQPGGPLYTTAVERAKAAMNNGKLAGILWHQGESDSSHDKVASYAGRFAAMLAQLRKDLHAEEVPVVIGELGRFRAASAEFNANLTIVRERVPRCAVVTAEDLHDKGDQTHFDSASLRLLGQRYAAAYQKMQGR